MNILHKIKHFLGINKGYCDAFYDDDGKLFMSFVCSECKDRSGIHPIDDLLDDLLKNTPPTKP